MTIAREILDDMCDKLLLDIYGDDSLNYAEAIIAEKLTPILGALLDVLSVAGRVLDIPTPCGYEGLHDKALDEALSEIIGICDGVRNLINHEAGPVKPGGSVEVDVVHFVPKEA